MFHRSPVPALFVTLVLLALSVPRAVFASEDAYKLWEKFDRIKDSLALTDIQAAKWMDAEKGQLKLADLLRDKTKSDRHYLTLLLDQGASDADLTAGIKAVQSDQAAMLAQAQKIEADLMSILTPTQMAEIVAESKHKRREQ
jgi:Spy/CpxP family protein refolding chaperone